MKVVKKMNDFSLKNIFKIVHFNLKLNKKSIIIWSTVIFFVMFLYMILFASMQDMVSVEIKNMPENILKFMGMNNLSDVSNYTSYFGMIFGIILIIISIFSAIFSSNLIYKEEKTKSIEFLNSLYINRNEIFFGKVITALISVFIVLFFGIASSIICGYINGGETFNLIDLLNIARISSTTVFVFLGIAFLLSGITTKISTPLITSIFALSSYLIGYLGQLLNKDVLYYFSPFILFNAKNALNMEPKTIICLIFYLFLIVICIFIGSIFYKKRDFNI